MIKLKSLLLKESPRTELPDPSLKEFLFDNYLHSFSGRIYHGTPPEGLKNMLVNGIYGTQHREIAEYDVFSTSVNPEMLHMFSDGHSETGLEFKVTDIKLLVINDMIHHLLIQLPGSGMEIENIDPDELEQFCNQYKIPMDYRNEYYLPYDYLSSLGVDAFVFEYTWNALRRGNMRDRDEHEIGFLKNGMPKLDKSIYTIYVNGNEYDLDEKQNALEDIEEYIES